MKPAAYRSIYVAMSFALTLTACGLGAKPDAAGQANAASGDPCGAQALADLVGLPVTGSGAPEEGPNVRYLRPGDMMTMDHRPDRLNIEIDADGRIEKVRCG